MKPSRFDKYYGNYIIEKSRFFASIQINNEREKQIGLILVQHNSFHPEDRVNIVPEKFSKLVEIVKDSDEVCTIIEKYKNIKL